MLFQIILAKSRLILVGRQCMKLNNETEGFFYSFSIMDLVTKLTVGACW